MAGTVPIRGSETVITMPMVTRPHRGRRPAMIWALRQDWHCGTEHATAPRITWRDHAVRQAATWSAAPDCCCGSTWPPTKQQWRWS